ncbi:MAG: DEAD/DEAH box helicase [Gammaproteobacteria bacterium]|nr:DEAD/DEAH box helicase [Gammaproteobacteria bacterium]
MAPPKENQSSQIKRPVFRGWISTDEDEIKRRKWRGRTEICEVKAMDMVAEPFCDYQAKSSTGDSYRIEIRSLSEPVNSCECMDFHTNRLGTCKHIEGVLHSILKGTSLRKQGRKNPRAEIFLNESGERSPRLMIPDSLNSDNPALVQEIRQRFDDLRRGSSTSLDSLYSLAELNSNRLRVSGLLRPWLDAQLALQHRERSRKDFLEQVKRGHRSLEVLKHPLLPYQTEGVLHLVFGQRVMLADDMGLGKTVQGIAACALLAEMGVIQRVLVVCPASLKAEWEEQIRFFSDLPATVVFGNRKARLKAYADRDFFTLCNYEQVRSERADILDLLEPDVVILDEAQRIKNWTTQTATEVKKLKSRYAFVLTGTPLENRIDEIYSIIQFLDPGLLGPLFRFNREFYQLNEKGAPVGYRNLDKLADRIAPIMLRRRKEEVEKHLPGRTTKTFFVPMTDKQMEYYEGYAALAARLAHMAKRRPLTADQMKKLQRYLACMRMTCDTPFILEDNPFECPKLDELKRILPDLLEDRNRKILIFSEWVRMLELVRNLISDAGWELAWLTGQVPQPRRRAEIHRFRKDPDCRFFLSSEAGGVGLNLQAADTVINMDLPWNPAKLEQRIARVWRKHQSRPVRIINFVSEDTIEHRMLGLLDAKRELAEGILDRRGDLQHTNIPNTRKAFLERVNEVLGQRILVEPGDASAVSDAPEKPEPNDLDRILNELLGRHGQSLRYLFALKKEAVLAVVDIDEKNAAKEERQLGKLSDLKVNIVDLVAYQSMLRLAQSGIIPSPTAKMCKIYPAESPATDESNARILRAQTLAGRAKHKLKAATLLEGGGFAEEALHPARDAAHLAINALAAFRGVPEHPEPTAAAEFLVEEDPDGIRGGLRLSIARLLSDDSDEPAGISQIRTFVGDIEKGFSNASTTV